MSTGTPRTTTIAAELAANAGIRIDLLPGTGINLRDGETYSAWSATVSRIRETASGRLASAERDVLFRMICRQSDKLPVDLLTDVVSLWGTDFQVER